MKLMLVLKRRGELMDAELPERGTRTPSERRGHGGISVPLAAWRAPRREQGGIPFGGSSQIARRAVDAERTARLVPLTGPGSSGPRSSADEE